MSAEAVTRESRMAKLVGESVLATDGVAMSTEQFETWLAERRAAQVQQVQQIALGSITNWSFDQATGNLGHNSGRFFQVEGLHVKTDAGPVTEWWQPIINQPEIGVLGILVREIDGVLHCLMQAKTEPGNSNGVQLSPTVQATKSNYTRVHGGSAIPYLEFFAGSQPEDLVADVLQSEQGAWFYRKRNRNMVVEVGVEVTADENFCWLTLGQLQELLTVDNLVNMDARTVLSCLPSFDEVSEAGRHSTSEVLHWITDMQTRHELTVSKVAMKDVRDWRRSEYSIAHESGLYFSVIGVEVSTNSREVGGWAQPLIKPHGMGVIAFLVRRFNGVLHVLVNARVEPGYLNVIELAPTVQCVPKNYENMSPQARPAFLDTVLAAGSDTVLFDVELSEEGGRFHHATNRYLIIDDESVQVDAVAGFTWLMLHQITDLLQHSHYVNVQARSLIACMGALR